LSQILSNQKRLLYKASRETSTAASTTLHIIKVLRTKNDGECIAMVWTCSKAEENSVLKVALNFEALGKKKRGI